MKKNKHSTKNYYRYGIFVTREAFLWASLALAASSVSWKLSTSTATNRLSVGGKQNQIEHNLEFYQFMALVCSKKKDTQNSTCDKERSICTKCIYSGKKKNYTKVTR